MPSEHPINARGQLVDVSLTSIQFKLNPLFDFDQHNASYSVATDTAAEVSDDRSSAVVLLDASLNWEEVSTTGDRTDAGDGVYPFDLALVVQGDFDISSRVGLADDTQAWLEFNSEFLLWPYLRSYVTQITAQAGLPPLTLATLTLPQPRLGREAHPATG